MLPNGSTAAAPVVPAGYETEEAMLRSGMKRVADNAVGMLEDPTLHTAYESESEYLSQNWRRINQLKVSVD